MNFTLEEKDNKIILKLILPKPKRNTETLVTENRIVVRDNTANKYLNDNNIRVGPMIKSGKNDNLNPPYESQWEFEKYQEKPLVSDEKINFSVDILPKNVLSSTKKRRKRKKLTTSSSLNE
jgi:hypothetical protein